MPLNTRWKRNDENISPPGGWDWPMLSAFMTVAFKEGSPTMEVREGLTFGEIDDGKYVDFSMAPIYYMKGCALIEHGYQVLTMNHRVELAPDRVVEFKAGDVLRSWRT